MTAARTTDLAAAARAESASRNVAQEALFERVAGRLLGYFHRKFWDEEEAREALQDTLLRLEESIREGSYDPTRSFSSWMWIKAHSVYVDRCRARARRRPTGDVPGAVVSRSPDPSAALGAREILERARALLGEDVYEVLLLRYESRLTLSEIAETLEVDRKTVSNRLQRVQRTLEDLLGRGGP